MTLAPARIREAVCEAFGVSRDALDQTGKEFQMNRYSPVSSAIQRMGARIAADRKWRRTIFSNKVR